MFTAMNITKFWNAKFENESLFLFFQHNGATGGYDMNIIPAWKKGYSGKGVVLTILDDGIEHNHPDLQDNYVSTVSQYSVLSIYRGQFSSHNSWKTSHSSPVRARYGVLIVSAKSNWSCTIVIAVRCAHYQVMYDHNI